MNYKAALFCAAGFFLQASPELQAAGCPGDPRFNPSSVIHFTSSPVQTLYFHNYSTAQIESMRHAQFHNGLLHNPGITLAEHELKTDFAIGGIQHGSRGPFCVWAQSVRVDFSFTQMKVYVSSQYAEGTCPYRVILWHENQHVAINNRAMAKYKVLMERALKRARTIPTKADPLAVASMAQGKAIISDRISRIINPIYEQFRQEVTRENAKIDTMANYKKTQAMCKDWR